MTTLRTDIVRALAGLLPFARPPENKYAYEMTKEEYFNAWKEYEIEKGQKFLENLISWKKDLKEYGVKSMIYNLYRLRSGEYGENATDINKQIDYLKNLTFKEYRKHPKEHKFNQTILQAHKHFVTQAVYGGRTVPAHVLAEYPNLQSKQT